MSSLKVVKLLPASAKVGELLQSLSVRWCFMYLSVAALHSSSATTTCVWRISARSLKYLSISSGRSSSKLGAARSCRAGKLANTILGRATGALMAGIAGGLGGQEPALVARAELVLEGALVAGFAYLPVEGCSLG